MGSAGKVYVVDDDRLVSRSLTRALEKGGYVVRTADGVQHLAQKISAWSPDVVLLDVNLPDGSGLDVLRELKERGVDTQVVMLTADVTADTAVQALRSGAADYLTKPFDLDEIRLIIAGLAEKQRLKREVADRRQAQDAAHAPTLIGSSPPMETLRQAIGKLARAQVVTVLITGESGTGKELVARALHWNMHPEEAGQYAPFVAVNCAAIPETLIESELFGHAKGSFTDAKTDKKGLIQQAEGGTLVLDEIGDMPMGLQTKLLRVLEERTFRRLGGQEEISVGCTVVASTNRNLPEQVASGKFRKDLFFRLSTFALEVVPLRERGGDAAELARHFLVDFAAKYGKSGMGALSPETAAALCAYQWPGNVRELRNVIERIVVLEAAEQVEIQHLPAEFRQDTGSSAASAAAPTGHLFLLPPDGLSLEEVKRDLIEQALELAGHNRVRAAKLLDISYDTLRYQLKRYGMG